MRSPQLHPLLPRAIPTPFPKAPAAVGKIPKSGPLSLPTHFPFAAWEVGEAGSAGWKKKNTTQKRTSRACVFLAASGVESGCRIRRSARVRLRGRGVFSTRPPTFQSPLPSPVPRRGTGPAPGPCSPAPAPVGFVSTGRRHPGCVPLDGTLGYLLEEAGGGRDSGVAGRFCV